MLIVANKHDALLAAPADRIVDALNLHIVQERVWRVQEVSVVTGEGIAEAVRWITDQPAAR